MNRGPDEVIVCPYCHRVAKYMTLNSGNTFGARAWTDGKQVFPMLPRPPAVVKCNHCAKCYWFSDAEKRGNFRKWCLENEQYDSDIEYIAEPNPDEYLEAIEDNLAKDNDEERGLRTLAWWRGNDAYRQSEMIPDIPAPLSLDGYRKNLEALAEMVRDRNPIMRAEILRELGQFEASITVLDTIEPGPYDKVVQQIRTLSESLDTTVKELQLDR